VPYLYSPEREVFVSYDDRRSIRRKVAYAERNDWGGVVIWALSHDRNGTLLTAVNDELADPSNETTGGDVATPGG